MRGTAVWSAPGRVNLIGEHTDYNDGFVLPFALSQRTTVTATVGSDPKWTVRSSYGDAPVSFDGSDLQPGRVPGWAGYVAGVVWVLRLAGVDVPFADLVVASEVPVGAGLSSSAALECATLAALVELSGAGDDLPRSRWPALARRAERRPRAPAGTILNRLESTTDRLQGQHNCPHVVELGALPGHN